jgi:hypothetical protein
MQRGSTSPCRLNPLLHYVTLCEQLDVLILLFVHFPDSYSVVISVVKNARAIGPSLFSRTSNREKINNVGTQLSCQDMNSRLSENFRYIQIFFSFKGFFFASVIRIVDLSGWPQSSHQGLARVYSVSFACLCTVWFLICGAIWWEVGVP